MSGPSFPANECKGESEHQIGLKHFISVATDMLQLLSAYSPPVSPLAAGLFPPAKRKSPQAKLKTIKRLVVEDHNIVKAMAKLKAFKIQILQSKPPYDNALLIKIDVLQQLLFDMARNPIYSTIEPTIMDMANVPALTVLRDQLVRGQVGPYESFMGNFEDLQRNCIIIKKDHREKADADADDAKSDGDISKEQSRDSFIREILILTNSVKDPSPDEMALILANMKLIHFFKRYALTHTEDPSMVQQAEAIYEFLQNEAKCESPNQQAFIKLFERIQDQLLPGMWGYQEVGEAILKSRQKAWHALIVEIQHSPHPNPAAKFIFEVAGQMLIQKLLLAAATTFSVDQVVDMPSEQVNLKGKSVAISTISRNEHLKSHSLIQIEIQKDLQVIITWQTVCAPATLVVGTSPDEFDVVLDSVKNEFIFLKKVGEHHDPELMQQLERDKRAFCVVDGTVTLTFVHLKDLIPDGILLKPQVDIQCKLANYVPHVLKVNLLEPSDNVIELSAPKSDGYTL